MSKLSDNVVYLCSPGWPAWIFMWVLAGAIFAFCKWLTWRQAPIGHASICRQLSYLAAWPGMNARGFLGAGGRAAHRRPELREWLFAISKLCAGSLLLCGSTGCLPSDRRLLCGWVGMIGLALMLHFGLFHLLGCGWRALGIDAPPLIDWPLCSVSLSEFWGRRWNTAFRDLTHQFVFAPLARRYGPRVALMTGFALSGVLHDLVISLPAGGGYGGPSLYFLIQAASLLAERSRVGRALGLGVGWRGWLFTLLVIAGPLCLLFHPAFIRNVVDPFLNALGAGGGVE